MLADVSRKFEDTFSSGHFKPLNKADNSIAHSKEPKVAGRTAENVLGFNISPSLENPDEKTSVLLY